MNRVKDSFPGGVCPNCQLDIPHDAAEGDECHSCGFVFLDLDPQDNEYTDDAYDSMEDIFMENDFHFDNED